VYHRRTGHIYLTFGVAVEELDIPIHMHLHEAASEIEQSLEQHGKRPMQRLAELGMLSERLIAVHMTQLEAAEIELAARHRINVVHCPESNLKLANGFCPVRELMQAGINVALGTDGAASNNDLDMVSEMRTAALLAKAVARDPAAVPAAQAIAMATLQGARALGMEDVIGSLAPRKEADIIAIDLGDPETQPVYDPVSQIVYAANRNLVTDVWVAGRPLMLDRELLTIDVESVLARAVNWAHRIRE